MSTAVWIILAGAVATYLTRIGGHLVLSRLGRVHPRVEAGLNAVPAAVLSTLVAPAAVSAGPAELLALIAGGLAALRGGTMLVLIFGGGTLILARHFLG
jgi:uncharacterized membrane protein